MGTYVFKWTKPATTVFVTGEFDNWKKTQELIKEDGVWSKKVQFPSATEIVHYKFFVDGAWFFDEKEPSDKDERGNTNNILYPSQITPLGKDAGMPGAFPAETPQAEKEQTFGVSPLPPSNSFGNPAPGDVNANSTTSHVKLDQASYERSDAYPTSSTGGSAILAATSGAFGVPPVTNTTIPESSLPMGEGATTRDPGLPQIQSAGAGTSTAALAAQVPLEPRGVPEVVSESQQAASASPEASANPEAIQRKDKLEQELQKKVPEEPATSEDGIVGKLGAVAAGAGGLVAAGAAAIGLTAGSQSNETKQQIASQGATSSGAQETPGTTTATGKAPGEQESVGSKAAAGAAAAGAAVAGGAAAAGAYATSKLPASAQDAIGANSTGTAKSVPGAVSDSQHQAHVGPEASGNPEAVTEKSAVEKELLAKVPQHNESGAPAPTASAVDSATAPTSGADASTKVSTPGEPVIADESTIAAIAVANRATGAPVSGDPVGTTPSSAAHTSQTAAVAGGAVAAGGAAAGAGAAASDIGSGSGSGTGSGAAAQSSGDAFKGDPVRAEGALGKAAGDAHTTIKNVTQEAKQSTVKAFQSDPIAAGTTTTGGATGASIPAPTSKARSESRDVSPMTRGTGAGTGSTTAAAPSAAAHTTAATSSGSPFAASQATAATGTPESAAGSPASKEQKKKNRRSFFGRIKDKLKDM